MSEMKLWLIDFSDYYDRNFIVRAETKEQAEKIIRDYAISAKDKDRLDIHELKSFGKAMVLSEGGEFYGDDDV